MPVGRRWGMATDWLTDDERDEVMAVVLGCRRYDADLRALALGRLTNGTGSLPAFSREGDQLRSDIDELRRREATSGHIRPPLVDWLIALASILKDYREAGRLKGLAQRVLVRAGLWSPPNQTQAELLQAIERILNRGAGLRSALARALGTEHVGRALLGAPVDVIRGLDAARGSLTSATERAALRDLCQSLVHWLIDWAGLVQRGHEQLAAGQPLTLPLITCTLAELFTAAMENRASAYQPPPTRPRPSPSASGIAPRQRCSTLASCRRPTGLLRPAGRMAYSAPFPRISHRCSASTRVALRCALQGRAAAASTDQRWYLVCDPDADDAGLRPHLEAAVSALQGLHLLHLTGPREDELAAPLTIDEEFDLAVLLTRIIATCPAGET
ncbi:MAG: hypothetical protein R3F43_29135 [bacterium]